ncbi:MAG: hypothetical protein COB56_01520 [Robiginitomaculum sp.]|nr:MAG: hypothetical protein COB56_01520 [Robiginitomaculum sp.]
MTIRSGFTPWFLINLRSNRKAALRLIRKLLKNQGVRPERIVTDRLASYGAALRDIGLSDLQDVGGRKNNRAECSHVPIRRRERKAQRFRSIRSAQRLLSAYGQIYNLFNIRRHLTSRKTMKIFRNRAMADWNIATSTGAR